MNSKSHLTVNSLVGFLCESHELKHNYVWKTQLNQLASANKEGRVDLVQVPINDDLSINLAILTASFLSKMLFEKYFE